jgi:hypothetical protein
MACCILGACLTALVASVSAFVRYRVLRRPRPLDPIAWHLELPARGATSTASERPAREPRLSSVASSPLS